MTSKAKDHDGIAKTCRGCGLLCDDVSIGISSSGELNFSKLCQVGEAWYQKRLDRTLSAGCLAAGKPVSCQEAIGAVAKILENCRAPVFAGLEWLDTRSQQAVVDLVGMTGGFVAPLISEFNPAGLNAFQRYGRATCTLGEIGRHRGLVCFWNVESDEIPARLIEKCLAGTRFIWNISHEKTAFVPGAAELGDRFNAVHATRNEQLQFIQQLRAMKSGSLNGIADSWKPLFDQFQQAGHIAFFIGKGTNDGPDPVIDGLHQLARSLNARVPCVILELGVVANSVSAREVLGWSTGQFSAGCFVPEAGASNESGLSLRDRLMGGGYDVAVIFESQILDGQVVSALSNREYRKLVCLDSANGSLTNKANVLIRVSETGWDHAGDFFRMDGIPVAIDSPVTSDRVKVKAIVDGVMKAMNGVNA